jgi:hypothetical protein
MFALIAILISFHPIPARPNAAGDGLPEITIRFVNGKTGKPVNDRPNVWLNKQRDPIADLKADENGEVKVTVDQAKDLTVRILPNQFADCRYKKKISAAVSDTAYLISDVLSKGIVTQNYCGHIQSEPKPGVLIAYVRPFTFMELWRM